MNIKRVGIGLAKSVFQAHGVDGQEKVVLRNRAQMLDYFKNPTRDGPSSFLSKLLAGFIH